MTIKHQFISFLSKKYPKLTQSNLNDLISDNLLSPFKISLPQKIYSQIESEVKELYALRKWSENHLSENFSHLDLPKAKNLSVCTSYDFHLNSDNQLKLIEVNTNAAFLALGLNLYEFLNTKTENHFSDLQLADMFINENYLNGLKNPNWYILDENPKEQRLFIEFLVYEQILNNHNIPTSIININEIENINYPSMIYNRYTDFYLQEPKSQKIKDLYKSGKIFLSPSPWDYFLIADKQRMFDWLQQSSVPTPKSLLKIYDLALSNKEEIWSIRKNYFFKPKSSFGSKQAYKGASMSRRVFDEAFAQSFIAQEYAAPSEITIETNGAQQNFKYDLRCYAYGEKLQLIIARLYQGQTTNLQTPGGGFAVVEFT